MSCHKRSLTSFFALSICKAVAIIAILFSGVSYAEGELVVMDAAYYYQCRDDFYRDCFLLQRQVDNFKVYADSELAYVTNAFWNISYNAGLARQNAEYIMSESSDPAVQSKADDIIMYANNCENVSLSGYNRALTLLSDVDSFVDNFSATISVVSNTFPVQVTSTNFVINVVVSNYFDLATNLYNDAQASYTNFLNYYSGIEDSLLNDYRATVTNLLDWSNAFQWNSYSLWSNLSSQYVNSWISSHSMYNILFGAIGWNNTSPAMYYGGLPLNTGDLKYWSQYFSSGSSADLLYFLLQGIHDSVEYNASATLRNFNLLAFASTNTIFHLPYTNSAKDREAYNSMKQFLTMPSGYTNQVAEVATSRNYYQRLEHWLSAIALNTSSEPSSDVESADTASSFDSNLDSFTNDVIVATSGLDQPLRNLGRMTNITVGVRGLVSSVSHVLDSFKSESTRSSSPPSDIKLMSTDFIQENFSRYNLTYDPQDQNGQVRYIGADSYTTGFDSARSAITWIHHFFGMIWFAVGLLLLCYTTYFLVSFGLRFWDKVITAIVRLVSFGFKD